MHTTTTLLFPKWKIFPVLVLMCYQTLEMEVEVENSIFSLFKYPNSFIPLKRNPSLNQCLIHLASLHFYYQPFNVSQSLINFQEYLNRDRMPSEGVCHSVAMNIGEIAGVVLLYFYRRNCQIMKIFQEECDGSDGTDEDSQTESESNSNEESEVQSVRRQSPTSDVRRRLLFDSNDLTTTMAVPLLDIVTSVADSDGTDEDSQTESESSSDEESEVESVRRQPPTSDLRRRLLSDSNDLTTTMAPLLDIVTSVAEFLNNCNQKHYGQFGSEDLMTALAQLAHMVTSIIESLQNNKNKLYERFGSETSSENLMTRVARTVDNVTSFAESLQNCKKKLYEQLKGLKDLSKQDFIRAMMLLVKDNNLAAGVILASNEHKEAFVLYLLGDAPCMERRNDDKIENDDITSLEDLQTQSEDEPESEDENIGAKSGEESEVESVQRHSPTANKRKRLCSDSEDPMLPLLERLAKTISCIAKFLKKPCKKEVYETLKTLSDLSKQDFNRARLLLVEDPDMAEGFMVLDEEHKMDFVLMLLGKA